MYYHYSSYYIMMSGDHFQHAVTRGGHEDFISSCERWGGTTMSPELMCNLRKSLPKYLHNFLQQNFHCDTL